MRGNHNVKVGQRLPALCNVPAKSGKSGGQCPPGKAFAAVSCNGLRDARQKRTLSAWDFPC